MTQEEILEYNKRCAEFLGIRISETEGHWEVRDKKGVIVSYLPLTFHGTKEETLEKVIFDMFNDSHGRFRFHLDWNCIMEVVEAIEKLNFTTSLTNNYFHIMKVENNIGTTVGSSKLNSTTKKEAVVQAINQFLIWYNEQK